MNMKRIINSVLVFALAVNAGAQDRFGGKVELDRTVYDFGDIQAGQGPVSCTYTVKNISDSPVTIFNVITSCGCTDAVWTREEIKPGQSGTISATYKNDEGAYPFDKTLTAYISDIKQPVVLHLRGVVHEKMLPLGEMYPVHFGDFGMREVEIKGGNMTQGQVRSGEMKVANLGRSPIEVSFRDISNGLKLSLSNSRIAPGETATLTYTVTSDRNHWGKSWYYATPVVNGRTYTARIVQGEKKKPQRGIEAMISDPNPEVGEGKPGFCVWTFIKEDFSSMSKEAKSAAANPMFESSTYSFGQVKAGTKVNAEFVCKNLGKSELIVYKADSDSRKIVISGIEPVQSGKKGLVTATLDTAGLPAGEVLFVITLTTNSPLRPMVNLYISGFIK